MPDFLPGIGDHVNWTGAGRFFAREVVITRADPFTFAYATYDLADPQTGEVLLFGATIHEILPISPDPRQEMADDYKLASEADYEPVTYDA
jgi:hypothetical protein